MTFTDPLGLDVKAPNEAKMGFCITDIDYAVSLAKRWNIPGPAGMPIERMWQDMKSREMPQTLQFVPTKRKARTTATDTAGGNTTIEFPKCNPRSGAKDIRGEDGMYYFHAAIIHELIHAYGRMKRTGGTSLTAHTGSYPEEAQSAGTKMNDNLDSRFQDMRDLTRLRLRPTRHVRPWLSERWFQPRRSEAKPR